MILFKKKIIQKKTWKSFACEESCQTIGWEAFKKNQCRAMLSYWYIFAHCSTMNLTSGKPLFLGQQLPKKGQKTGGYRLQHNQMWFFTFFLVSILYIKFWAVCCFVLPSEWVKSISTTLNHSHFLFTTMWSVLTYSLVLYFFSWVKLDSHEDCCRKSHPIDIESHELVNPSHFVL